jgi:hypothetical protein
MKVSETALVKGCLEYLKLKRIMAWRMNSGGAIPIVSAKYGRRAVYLGPKGLSDIIGMLPGGRFLAVEVKVGRKKPTPAQSEFLSWVNDAGGLGVVVWSLEELEKVIDGVLAVMLAETNEG